VLASLTSVKNLVPAAVLGESLRQRRFTGRRPDVASETAEERPVPRADAFQHERPGMRGFVAQRVLAFGRREV
jgi:hypothetical protein